MKGYSDSHIFTGEERSLLRRATRMIEALADADWESVRCHELARAVGRVLGLEVEDGFYGFVDHSWLWTRPKPAHTLTARIGFPNILDVYSVGSLPMVRLVACENPSLPHVGWAYRPGPERTDVKHGLVDVLVEEMGATDRTHARIGIAETVLPEHVKAGWNLDISANELRDRERIAAGGIAFPKVDIDLPEDLDP